MIVYRSQSQSSSTSDKLHAINAQLGNFRSGKVSSFEAIQRLLISFGALESALADALEEDAAGSMEKLETARDASVALGCALYCAHRDQPTNEHLDRFAQLFDTLTRYELPSELNITLPEGYAHYALFPVVYLDAAEKFLKGGPPPRAVVIGIRSIGTSLSAAVAGVLKEHGCEVHSYAVRPTGHPWDRTLRAAASHEREWRALSSAEFLVVDEGPGISGSSFASIATKLSACGVGNDRISFFPSWDAPADCLGNSNARDRWRKHERYTGSIEEPWLEGMRDLSAGKWRDLLYAGDEQRYPAIQPQHESRKYLSSRGTMLKFAGLGEFGEWKFERQKALANAGFSTNPVGWRNGFLELEFVPGRPLSSDDCSYELLDRMARYLAFRAHTWPAERSLSFDSLLEMIEVNAKESLDREVTAAALRRLAAKFNSRPAAEIDGRMMPHEWIETERGWLKTDAVDHHTDHFFPGSADIAWDLAAASIEFQLSQPAQQFFLDCYYMHSGDQVPADIFNLYRIAWLAFRTGYTSMAADATSGTDEHDRFSALRLALACQLQRELVHYPVTPSVRISA